MHYEQEKAIQRELNERIPPAPKGDPQNELRHVVNSQRMYGKSFDAKMPLRHQIERANCAPSWLARLPRSWAPKRIGQRTFPG
jgi:hypothetical protein